MFCLIVFFMLSSCSELKGVEYMYSMKQIKQPNKSKVTSHKISTNLPIQSYKIPLDISQTRKGSYLLQTTRSLSHNNLKDLNRRSYVVIEPSQDAKEDIQKIQESIIFENPLLITMGVLTILFLFLKVISKFNLEKTEPMIFVITVFSLVNPAYLVGPLFYTPTYLTDNNGGYKCQFESIDVVLGQGYCTMVMMQNADSTYSFLVNKYNSDGSSISSTNRGSLAWDMCSDNFWRSVFYVNGKCKAFYSSSTGNTNFVNFYDGVSTHTDIHITTDHHTRIYKGLALSDGSYFVVGFYVTTSFIYKVDSLNMATSVTDANMQYRTVVQYDDTHLYVLLLDTSSNNHYLKPITTSLVLGNPILIAYNNSYNLQDAILSSDKKIVILGNIKDSPFISKTSIAGTNLWYTTLTTAGIVITPQHFMLAKDGSYILTHSHIISSKNRPYIASVSETGAINWEATYTGYANNAIINGIQSLDDYSVTLIGGADDGRKDRPFMLKVTLACPTGYTVNDLRTACIIPAVCTPGNYRSTLSLCLPCPAGSFSTASVDACTRCSQGTYQNLTGQTSCLPCPINQYSNSIAPTSCTACKDTEYACYTGFPTCVPCPGGYCGVCKLHDRSLCDQLIGICWTSYNDKCANISIGYDCAVQMASICYKIWMVNGTNDTQCADFTNLYNFTLMQIKPSLINAYYKEDGQSFLLEFDQDISQVGFTDASSIFDSNTLKWLPSPPSAQWINSRTLQVSFSPGRGILNSLTILPNTLYSTYKYAQASVTATNFPVKLFF